MLTYPIDQRGDVPLYLYLYQCIRKEIVSGVIPPGSKMPSKRALATHLSVSVGSVMRTYDQLLLEGYIYTRERKGYYVCQLEHYQNKKPRRSAPRLDEVEARRQLEPTPVFDFKANRVSLSMFPMNRWAHCMREALSLSDESLLQPVPFCGMLALRRAISLYLLEHKGITASPSQIVIGAGTEYLYSRLLHLFPADQVLALENPGYSKFEKISASYGRRCVFIPIDTHGIQVDQLEESGAQLVHVSPANHFPTGIVTPVSRRLELHAWADRAPDRYIIEDDYDSEFRHTGNYIPPMYSIAPNNRVIYINTFSKTLVPSIRISYMVLPLDLMQRYENNLSFYTCTASSFEQYALSLFLEQGYFERHLNRLRKYYRDQRRLVLQAFRASPLSRISTIWEEKAGTHFLIHLHTELSESEIAAKGEEQGLVLSFLTDYYSRAVPLSSQKTLVFNYAGFTPDKIDPILSLLEQLFAGDIARETVIHSTPALANSFSP